MSVQTSQRESEAEINSQLSFKVVAPHYNELELAYFAGFFDGEGNIHITHVKATEAHPYEQYRLRVCVAQKDPGILHDYEKTFGGGIDRRSGQWYVYGIEAANFLKSVLPYLRFKQKEAIIAIRFQKLVRGHTNKSMPQSLFYKQAELYRESRIKSRAINPK